MITKAGDVNLLKFSGTGNRIDKVQSWVTAVDHQ